MNPSIPYLNSAITLLTRARIALEAGLVEDPETLEEIETAARLIEDDVQDLLEHYFDDLQG